MKKVYNKLSVILIMLLTLVIVFGTAGALFTNLAHADSSDTATFQADDENEAWYEITVGEDNKSLTILVDGNLGSYADLSKKDLTDIKAKLLDAIKKIVINRLMESANSESGGKDIQTLALYDGSGSSGGDIELPDFSGSTLEQYEKYIRDRLMQPGELDKYLRGDYDVMIKYAVDQYLSAEGDQIEDIVKFSEKVTKQVNEIVDQVIEEKYQQLQDEIKSDSSLTEDEKAQKVAELEQEKADAKGLSQNKTGTLVQEVVENGGASITVAELIKAIDSIAVDGNILYSGGKLSLAAVKKLLFSLPKPGQIAQFSDDEMELGFDIDVETTFGGVDFRLVVGLKSGYQHVRTAAKFIAEHIDVSHENGVYNVTLKVPDEFAAVLLKATTTAVVPDNIKLALFGMLNKPANEIADKVGGYTYEQVLDYIKGIQFHKLFSNVLNAEYLRSLLKDYGIDIASLTDENINKFLNAVLDYAERIANKKDVAGLEEFLHRYGIPGIPKAAEGLVQKFLNLLNKIDYERYDAEEVKKFLTSEERINNFIGRLEGSYKVKSLYETFVDYAETLFGKLPQRLQNGKFINLYKDENTLAWAGDVNIDIKKIVTKLVETANKDGTQTELQTAVDTALGKIDGNLNYNVKLDLTVSIPDIYKITYKNGEDTVGVGLLPVGANAKFFAGEKMTEEDVIAWVDAEGRIYSVAEGAEIEMPANDIEFDTIIGYNASLSLQDGGTSKEITEGKYSKVYDGYSIVLTAAATGGRGYDSGNIRYQWYKVEDNGDLTPIEGANEASYTVISVLDSGEYVCEISCDLITVNADEITYTVSTDPVTLSVTPATINFAGAKWQVTDVSTGDVSDYDAEANEYEYTGSAFSLKLADYPVLPEGVKIDYYNNEYSAVGEYRAYFELSGLTQNYQVEHLPDGYGKDNAITWKIKEKTVIPPEPDDPNAPEKGYWFEFEYDGTLIRIKDNNGVVPKTNGITAENHASNYEVSDFEGYLQLEEGKEAVIEKIYDIKFNSNVPDGSYDVQIINSSFSGKEIVVLHIHGSVVEKPDGYKQDGATLSFTVSNFSDFASISVKDKVVPPVVEPTEEENDNWWIWLLIAVIIILLIIIIILIIYLLRKENEPEDGVRPSVIIIRTDEVEEVEESVEESETESAAEEESAVAAAEESAETAPAAEEETAVVAAEESAEADEAEVPMPLVADDGSRIVYDKSFRARLSQSDSIIKDYYTELKNDILSYKGVKSRVSWHFDSFNKGRTKCIKLQLRGKSMYMYIALPASELPAKYHVKDVSAKARYQDVPTMLKIRKPRSLKYAKQLVAILMERLGVERGATPTEKYRPRYRSTRSLIDMGLIKVKYTRSTFAAPKRSSDDTNN